MSYQRKFIIVALSLILFSSIAGAFFAFHVEQRTLLQLREQYEQAFVYAAEKDFENAGSSLKHAETLNYRYVRIIDAHTHVITLASLLLLISLVLPLLNWENRTQFRFAIALAAGAVVFPVSVYMQVYVSGLLFKATSAAGALLIIASMSMLVVSLFRNKTA